MSKVSSFLLLVFVAFSAQASQQKIINLGKVDKVYSVIEIDPRNEIEFPNFKQLVHAQFSDLKPQRYLTSINTTKTVLVDVSFVLEEDVYNSQKKLKYRKGKVINPLLKIKPKKWLLFFNAKKNKEILKAVSLMQENHNIIPVMTSGNFYQTAKIFPNIKFAYHYILDKFNINHTPALLRYEEEISQDKMVVTYYPFQ